MNEKLGGYGAVKTLEQHVKPLGKVVQNKKPYTRDVVFTTNIVEKRKNLSSKNVETCKVEETVTIKVTGDIWAYRPKPK